MRHTRRIARRHRGKCKWSLAKHSGISNQVFRVSFPWIISIILKIKTLKFFDKGLSHFFHVNIPYYQTTISSIRATSYYLTNDIFFEREVVHFLYKNGRLSKIRPFAKNNGLLVVSKIAFFLKVLQCI